MKNFFLRRSVSLSLRQSCNLFLAAIDNFCLRIPPTLSSRVRKRESICRRKSFMCLSASKPSLRDFRSALKLSNNTDNSEMFFIFFFAIRFGLSSPVNNSCLSLKKAVDVRILENRMNFIEQCCTIRGSVFTNHLKKACFIVRLLDFTEHARRILPLILLFICACMPVVCPKYRST